MGERHVLYPFGKRRSRVAPPELLTALIEAAPIAIFSVDDARRVLTWNQAAEELFGWKASEVLGRVNPLVPPERAEEYARILDTVWGGGSVRNLRTERIHRNGARIPVLVTLNGARDAEGNVIAAIGFFADDSGARNAEHKLRRARDAQMRRTAQQQAVAGFSRRALMDGDAGEIIHAALLHVALALRADGCELLERRDGLLVSRAQFGFQHSGEVHIPIGGDSVFDDALQSRLPVSRWLQANDHESAPHLRFNSFRFATAANVSCQNSAYILAAYSREHPFDLGDAHPLQTIASMLSAAITRHAVEHELATQQARLHMLLDQMPAILWIVDENLVVTVLEGGPLAAVGRDPRETIGRSLHELNAHQGAIDAAREALAGNVIEYRHQDRDRMWNTHVHPLYGTGGEIEGAIALALDVTARTAAERQVLTIQEDERRRVSRELHDDLGQQLTALRFDAALLRDQLAPEAAQRAGAMIALIDDAIASIRRVAAELRPAVLDDFGLRAALEHEVATFSRRTGIETAVVFHVEPSLEAERATALYRITREALTNVARHASARHVHLSFAQHDGWLREEIADDGRGIDPAALHDPSSLGLIGMRERAHAFGGSVTIDRLPDGGTGVVVLFPLPS